MNKIFYTLFLLLGIFEYLPGQLSPGDLHQSHSHLEGIKNCRKCHEFGKKITSGKCLNCHILLQTEIKQKRGAHSLSEYQECQTCHIEHQGKNFELVWWKNGKDGFDHSQTGFSLQGKHKELKCRDCHQKKYMSHINLLLKHKKSLNRTFLGLTPACISCHYDEHRGQLGKACQNCHLPEGWKPATGFDHNKARFQLTGKHVKVDCQKCHPKIVDNKYENDADFLKFTPLKIKNCISCHQDVHQHRFGNDCQECHTTAGWNKVLSSRFSHALTNFPLRGKHARLACTSCHLPGKSLRGLPFQRCRDCHKNYHQGQFSEHNSQEPCKTCHSEQGFTPARFTLAQHNKTGFPLDGAHRAVPCIACHQKDIQGTTQFYFATKECSTCHQNPHQHQVDKYIMKNGCSSCHSVESWKKVIFDHLQTTFELKGRHQALSCRLCHQPPANGSKSSNLKFLGTTSRCADCHQDPHLHQFRTNEENTECDRCHTPTDWLAENFDHNRDTKFPLTGGHKLVQCKRCHPTITKDGETFVLYKPLKSNCNACHNSTKAVREPRK